MEKNGVGRDISDNQRSTCKRAKAYGGEYL